MPMEPGCDRPRWLTTAVPQYSLYLIEVLSAVLTAGRVDRTIGVTGCHPFEGELRHPRIRLLRQLQGEFCCRPRHDRVDQRTGRVGEPVTLVLGVGRDPLDA